jgi:hypothetical protein
VQLQKIQFWNRALYPFVCLVMVGLALPFAYLHARSGGVSIKVFAGIMLGVSFVLLNNVFRHLGLLGNWTPWLVAATPGALLPRALARRVQLAGPLPLGVGVTHAIVLFATARATALGRAVRGGRRRVRARRRSCRSRSPSSS